ncbi:MAG: family 1 extracellular solute-binding protein [Paenibacillus sp.]|jgi:ABC-type glycerol-3-phosphate transport system substrate-binding protein|nr:family 1 extracellular solute-binding protein [Paenibacillus sp.]
MKMKRMLALTSVFSLAVTGCGGKENGNSPAAEHASKPPQPIELSFYSTCAKYDDAEFEKEFAGPTRAKFPHITFDIGLIQPEVVKFVQNYSDNGALYMMPKRMNAFATYYNKDIFDKFGVAYPKDMERVYGAGEKIDA